MTPTAEEHASTSTHLAGRTTYTNNQVQLHIKNTASTHFYTTNTNLQSKGITTFKNQEDWGHFEELQEDYTGGSPHQHTGGLIYLVIVIYIVSCIV